MNQAELVEFVTKEERSIEIVREGDGGIVNDLSGFEFEDVIEDVFRDLGYENARQAERTADEGRASSWRRS